MNCPKCGTQVPEGALFCHDCGTRLGQGSVDAQEKMTIQEDVVLQESEIKQKGTSNKKLFLIAAAVIVGIAAIAGIAAALFLNNPKRMVLQGLANTMTAVATEETGIQDYLGWNDLSKLLVSEKSRQTMSAEIPMEDLGFSVGGNVGVSFALDRDSDKEMYLDAGITLGDMNLQVAQLYSDRDTALAAIPRLYCRSFCLDSKKLKEKAENGELFDLLSDVYGVDLDEEQKDNIKEFIKEYPNEARDFTAEYIEYSTETWSAILQNMQVKKTDSRKFTIAGKERSCRAYQIRITQEDLKQAADNLAKFMDDEIIPYINTVSVVYDADDVAEFKKELYDMIQGDLEFVVYIGPKKRMVGISYDGGIGEEINLEADVRLLGEKNPLDDVSATFALSNDTDTYALAISRNLTDDDSHLLDVAELKVSGPDSETVVFTYEGILDKSNGDWQIELGVNADEETGTLTFAGAFENVTKGERFTVVIDQMDIDMPYTSSPDMNFAVTYGLEPISQLASADILAMETLDVLEVNESDLQAVTEEMTGSLMGLVFEIASSLGLSFSDILWLMSSLP